MLTIPLKKDFSKYKTIQYQLLLQWYGCWALPGSMHETSLTSSPNPAPHMPNNQILSYIPMYYNSLLCFSCIHFLLTKFWIVATIYRADNPLFLPNTDSDLQWGLAQGLDSKLNFCKLEIPYTDTLTAKITYCADRRDGGPHTDLYTCTHHHVVVRLTNSFMVVTWLCHKSG